MSYPASYPAAYVGLLPVLSEVAMEHGYALAVHGSLRRDMDLIAVPWSWGAVTAETLVARLLDHLSSDIKRIVEATGPEENPHGRLSWRFHLESGLNIDISITPRHV